MQAEKAYAHFAAMTSPGDIGGDDDVSAPGGSAAPLPDATVCSSLISALAQVGLTARAKVVLDKMRGRGLRPGAAAFNLLVLAMARGNSA